MAGAVEIIGYVALAVIVLFFFASCCGSICQEPLAVANMLFCAMAVPLFLCFLILSPLWLPFYPFLDNKYGDDDRFLDILFAMSWVVEFYIFLLCLLLSPVWLPALWIEMCMVKYENGTWPELEPETTTLLLLKSGYTKGVCLFYSFVIVTPVGLVVYLVAYLINVILLVITMLLVTMTCNKTRYFDNKLVNEEVHICEKINDQVSMLGISILLVLYILTGPIWFPFWICRSFCLSKADSDKELERDNNDTTAKNDDDLEKGDAAATDGRVDVADHDNASAQDDEIGDECGTDDVSAGVNHEDDLNVEDQVDEEKGDGHGDVGTKITKSKEMTTEDEESGRGIVDQERGTGNVATAVVEAFQGQDAPTKLKKKKKKKSILVTDEEVGSG